MKHYVIEIVEFKLVEGADLEKFIAANELVAGAISALDGFIDRALAQDDDGQWVDIVRWQDMACAKTAAAQVMQIEGFGALMKFFDTDSVKMKHFTTRYIM
ncbi:MAG: hypothetical protein COC24_014620 [Alphaproteobacteria bacterium]|nr:hypothetical protein [Alphaproteobacteria bacterium]